MNGIKQDIKIKLQRLKSLEDKEYNFETLNIYVESYNNFISTLKLKDKPELELLKSNIGSMTGGGPTAPERTEMDRLINIYTELLTAIDPNEGKSILGELKETSKTFKTIIGGINLALLFACAWLFYNLGKDAKVKSQDKIEDNIVESTTETKPIDSELDLIDSLRSELERLNTIAYPSQLQISYLKPSTLDGGELMIKAKETYKGSELVFVGEGIRISKEIQDTINNLKTILVNEGDRFYIRNSDSSIRGVNVLSTVIGVDIQFFNVEQ